MKIQLSEHFDFKKLLRFTLPSIIMLIFTSVYGVVDGFFDIKFCRQGIIYCRQFYNACINASWLFWIYDLAQAGGALNIQNYGRWQRMKKQKKYFADCLHINNLWNFAGCFRFYFYKAHCVTAWCRGASVNRQR